MRLSNIQSTVQPKFQGLVMGLYPMGDNDYSLNAFYIRPDAVMPFEFTKENRFPNGNGRVPNHFPADLIPLFQKRLIAPFGGLWSTDAGSPFKSIDPPEKNKWTPVRLTDKTSQVIKALDREGCIGIREGLTGKGSQLDVLDAFATLVEETSVISDEAIRPKVAKALRNYNPRTAPVSFRNPIFREQGHLYHGEGEIFSIPLSLQA